MSSHGPVTIKDVARHASVSTTTVSGVINNRSDMRVTEATRQRVLASIQALNFRPNRNARSLRTQSSQTIAVVIDHAPWTSFASQILAGAQQIATEHDSLLLLGPSGFGELVEASSLNALIDRQVDGLVFITQRTRHIEIPAENFTVPSVLVNCFSDHTPATRVLPDDVHGQILAVNAALAFGHRSMIYLAGDGTPVTKQRVQGFRTATTAAGLGRADVGVVYGDYQSDSGYDRVIQLAKEGTVPTVILCASDNVAVGTHFALKDLGLRVPDDVSIIGYDDSEALTEVARPGLATVAAPAAAMGKQGLVALFDLISGAPPRSVVVRGTFVQRGSLGVPRP